RSWALWFLGYPNAALSDVNDVLKDAREIGHAPTLMYALNHASCTNVFCQNYTTANVDADELATFADEKRLYVEGARNGVARWDIGSDRPSFGSRPHAHPGDHRIAFNGSNGVGVVPLVTFGKSVCGTRPIP